MATDVDGFASCVCTGEDLKAGRVADQPGQRIATHVVRFDEQHSDRCGMTAARVPGPVGRNWVCMAHFQEQRQKHADPFAT
jgi:hypothetical protein